MSHWWHGWECKLDCWIHSHSNLFNLRCVQITSNVKFLGSKQIIHWRLCIICSSMPLWNDLLSSTVNWCFNDAWNVQISNVSFISELCAFLKIGLRCSYVVFMRFKMSIQRGPFILCTWEQVSKCQFQWFIFHVRIEMSHPSIIPALIVFWRKYILDIVSIRELISVVQIFVTNTWHRLS